MMKKLFLTLCLISSLLHGAEPYECKIEYRLEFYVEHNAAEMTINTIKEYFNTIDPDKYPIKVEYGTCCMIDIKLGVYSREPALNIAKPLILRFKDVKKKINRVYLFGHCDETIIGHNSAEDWSALDSDSNTKD